MIEESRQVLFHLDGVVLHLCDCEDAHATLTPHLRRSTALRSTQWGGDIRTGLRKKRMPVPCADATRRVAASASHHRGRSTTRLCSPLHRAHCCWGRGRCFWAPAGPGGRLWSLAPCLQKEEWHCTMRCSQGIIEEMSVLFKVPKAKKGNYKEMCIVVVEENR